MSDSEPIKEVKLGKRSYIYKCSKQELQQICKDENLAYFENSSVEELRKIISEFYKNKSFKQQESIKKMNTYGELKLFDGEKWEVFQQQLECFILLNDIEDSKKVHLLVTKLTPKVYETLTHLCSPVKPYKLPYEEICKKLKQKYTQTLSTVLEKAKFRQRNQQSTEKIEDYVLELRKLAGKCHFKDTDDQIKEKLIDGVTSKMIKFELMKSPADMTLEQCIQVAQTVEAALLHTDSPQDINDIFINRTTKKPTWKIKINQNSEQQGKKCYCCGKNNHLKSECTLRKKFCSECGQQGHIYRMCQKKLRQTNILETELEENKEQNSKEKEVIEENPYTEYETYSYRSMPNNM